MGPVNQKHVPSIQRTTSRSWILNMASSYSYHEVVLFSLIQLLSLPHFLVNLVIAD